MEKQSVLDFVGPMSELERKFIIMSRIAVALNRKGFISTVVILTDFCHINVQDSENKTVDDIYSNDVSEHDLLDWWSKIENNVE